MSNVIDVKKWLNKNYEGKKGYTKLSEDETVSEEVFESLRQAVAIERELDEPKDWNTNRETRKNFISKLTSGLGMFSENVGIQLANCAFVFHGINADIENDMYGAGFMDCLQEFCRDLNVGTGGLGMDNRQWTTLFSNVPTKIAPDGNIAIQSAEQRINEGIQGINNDAFNEYDPYGRCDGIYEKDVYTHMILWLQNVEGNPITGVYDDKTKADAYKADSFYGQYLEVSAWALNGLWQMVIDDRVYGSELEDQEDNAYNSFCLQYGIPTGSVLDPDHKNYYSKLFELHPIKNAKVSLLLRYTFAPTTLGIPTDDQSVNQCIYLSSDEKELYFDQYRTTKKILSNDNPKTSFNWIYKKNADTNPIAYSTDKSDFLNSDDKDDQEVLQGHNQTLYVLNKDSSKWIIMSHMQMTEKIDWSKEIICYKSKNNNIDSFSKSEAVHIVNIENAYRRLWDNAVGMKRFEMAISPDEKSCLFAPIDNNGTQYFMIYNFEKLSELIKNSKDGVTINLDELNKTMLLDHYSILNFTNKNKVLGSVQGYALANDQTIYVSSQYGPKFSDYKGIGLVDNVSEPKILKVAHDKDDSIVRKLYKVSFDYRALDEQFKATNTLGVSELEGIQIVGNTLFISLAWHALERDSGTETRYNTVYQTNLDMLN